MDVIIVSKTHMASAVCVGALGFDGRSYRLLDNNGNNQLHDTEYEIRQIWKIDFRERSRQIHPHTEDVLVYSKKLAGTVKSELTMLDLLYRFNVSVWRGSPDILFEDCLLWTNNGSGYLSIERQIPNRSTGFWIPDKDLTKRIFYGKVRYNYPNVNGWRSLPYVGFEASVDQIPAGTLLRVSLARWWKRDSQTETRCSLQLSGWYDLTELNSDCDTDGDLPF